MKITTSIILTLNSIGYTDYTKFVNTWTYDNRWIGFFCFEDTVI